ncbi:HlyD family efflux transporter periplasmic adaptor subunit [uncultured Methylobacterium sp.]|uniref:HlyD family efflux transporter periplasmic adaptor subunit n=1 Tax=uncultured Methylobacterium sp. TaxID=157278 RepID=UPI0035CC0993
MTGAVGDLLRPAGGDRPRPAGGRLDAYHETLLDSLADGVLSISPDRCIEVLNATGAEILGCSVQSILGSTLIEAFLYDEANDAFVDAILAAGARNGGTIRSVVPFRRGGEERRLAVASTGYRGPAGPQADRLGVVVTFNDVTEMLRLREAEDALQRKLATEHANLQAAYVKIEALVQRERRIAQRVGLIRTMAIIAVFATFAGIGLYNWQTAAPLIGGGRGAGAPETQTVTVATQPVTSRVAVVGTVDPGSVVSVVGPFDGPIRQKLFEYGGAVERGQPLATLDVSDIQLRLREAEGTRIKARQRLDEMRNWENGVEVSRARRTITAAETESNTIGTRLKQTKMLLAKGIVAAEEYNQLVQQQNTQAMQLETAKQDFKITMDRGSEENRRIVEYELLNAQAKVDELQRDLANATILAPVSGVVLQPPEGDAKRPESLGVGSRVARGQSMFTIGNLENFSIRSKVDEIDVNKVRIGQAAVVTGDAFEGLSLDGTVTNVSAQAVGESAARAGMSTFPISVRMAALTPEQRSRVHVGMSATLSIVVYDNPAAIVLPVAAVRTEGEASVVSALRDGRDVTVPVKLGISTPEGIEVREGLNPGDVVRIDK